jgi:Spy/CpxP family protein refolding chaperone
MNRRTRARFVRSTAAAILAAAVIPLSALAQDSPRADRSDERRAELGLTPEQTKALADLRQARGDERQAFRAEMDRIRGEMRELARDPEANRSRIEALIDKRAGLRAEREKSALRSRADWRKIFTPEQLAKMRSWRHRLAIRPGRIGRSSRAIGRLEARRPGLFRGPGSGAGRLARMRDLRCRQLLRRWRER